MQIDVIPTKEYADLVARNLTDHSTHPPEYYHPVYDIPEDHGTVSTISFVLDWSLDNERPGPHICD